jgi:hypothetical protein
MTVSMHVHHYIWITEYLWQRIHPTETGKVMTVLDVKGVGVMDLVGETLEAVRACMAFTQDHYLERSSKVLIINAGWTFSNIWRMVSVFVNDVTKQKLFILSPSETKAKLLEFIDSDQLPVMYGGTCSTCKDNDCRFGSPWEQVFFPSFFPFSVVLSLSLSLLHLFQNHRQCIIWHTSTSPSSK